jgi:hypothetical protein
MSEWVRIPAPGPFDFRGDTHLNDFGDSALYAPYGAKWPAVAPKSADTAGGTSLRRKHKQECPPAQLSHRIDTADPATPARDLEASLCPLIIEIGPGESRQDDSSGSAGS